MFKKIEIEKEIELKELLKREPESIEPGLKVLADEFPVEGGYIDLLCVDSGNVLTIIELKIEEDDYMLMQTMRYYDYVSQNVDKIAKLYSKIKIATDEEPRIILIAPAFSETLRKSAKYVDLKLDLFEYDYLSTDHTRGLVCRSVDIETPKEMPARKTVEDHLNYITNEKVRNLCAKTIEKIEGIGEDIEAHGVMHYVGFKYRGRLFARLKTKRNYFYTMGVTSDTWEYDKTRIEKKSDFSEEHFNKIKRIYQDIGGKIKK